MSGTRLYGADGEVIVDGDRDAHREALLGTLAASVGMLLEAHEALLENMLRDGLTPNQRKNLGEHIGLARQFQEDILTGSLELWGRSGDGT